VFSYNQFIIRQRGLLETELSVYCRSLNLYCVVQLSCQTADLLLTYLFRPTYHMFRSLNSVHGSAIKIRVYLVLIFTLVASTCQ